MKMETRRIAMLGSGGRSGVCTFTNNRKFTEGLQHRGLASQDVSLGTLGCQTPRENG